MYFTLMGASLRGQLQYRINFVLLIATGIVWQGTGFAFIWVILGRFGEIAGWSLGAIAFLYGVRLVIHALSMMAFGLLQRLEIMVRRADIDFFLVRPLPPLLQIVTFRFPVAAFGDLAGGVVIVAAAGMRTSISWSPVAIAYLLLAVAGGCLTESAVKLVLSSAAFRTLSAYPLVTLFDDTLSVTGSYPLVIYASAVQWILTFLVPVAFVAYLPVTVLLGRTGELMVPQFVAYISPLVGAFLFTAAYLVFRHELNWYQSAGS